MTRLGNMKSFGYTRRLLILTCGALLSLCTVASVRAQDDVASKPVNSLPLNIELSTESYDAKLLSPDTSISTSEAHQLAMIMEQGEVQGKWKACDLDEKVGNNAIASGGSSCVTIGPYAARLLFLFSYANGRPDLTMAPEIVSSNPDVKVRLQYFDHDSEERRGEFALIFDCKNAPGKSARIQVKTQEDVVDIYGDELYGYDTYGQQSESENEGSASVSSSQRSLAYSFAFIKECGKGTLGQMVIKQFDPETYSVSTLPASFSVSEMDLSTNLLIEVVDPVRYLFLEKPVVTTSNSSALDITLRGSLSYGGVLQASEKADLSLIYSCKQAKANIEVTLALKIPPFDDQVIRWKKHCGDPQSLSEAEGFIEEYVEYYNDVEQNEVPHGEGDSVINTEPEKADTSSRDNTEDDQGSISGFAQQQLLGTLSGGLQKDNMLIVPMIDRIRIGTQAGIPDVFTEGHPLSKYEVISNTLTTSTLYHALRAVKSWEHDIEFEVWNQDPRQKLTYESIQVTASHPDIVRGYVATESSSMFRNALPEHDSDVPAVGGVLRIHLVCRAKGESRVMVSMVLKTLKVVEFGFVKECEAPRRRKHRASFSAATLTPLMYLVMLSIGAVVIYRLSKDVRAATRQFAQTKYQPS